MANLVNVKFNQLLSRVQGRVQGESKGFSIVKTNPAPEETKGLSTTNPTSFLEESKTSPSLGESKGLSISKVATSAASETTDKSGSKNAEQVVFSLKDFMEKTKTREEEGEKVDDDVEDVEMEGDEEVEEKKAAESSEDESVIDDEESMMQEEEEDDSDLEVIVKADEKKKSGNDMEDSDIENEITKLHDIIGELSKPDLEKDLKEEKVKIVDEKTDKDPEVFLPTRVAFESQPTKEPIDIAEDGEKPEKAGLQKFSGLSIKKSLKGEESESRKKPEDVTKEEEKTGKNDDDEEVKIEGTPIFSEMTKSTGQKSFLSKPAPNPSQPMSGLRPGLKVEIKEVQGRRFPTKRKAAESPSRQMRGSKKASTINLDEVLGGSKKSTTINVDEELEGSNKPSINTEETVVIGERMEGSSAKRNESPILVGDESPKNDSEVTLEETTLKEDVFEDEDEEVTEFDLCTHGDLVNDYLCYECTYNRWRVGWNKRVPEEKRKSRPEFLELSHKLNIGHIRNISIQRAKPSQPKPEKPAEEKEEKVKADEESKTEPKSENEKKPEAKLNSGKMEDRPTNMKSESDPKATPKKENSSFKLPPGVNLSNSGGFKNTGAGFSRLPSGISFTSTKPTVLPGSKSDPIPPTSSSSPPAPKTSVPPPTSQETPSSSNPPTSPPPPSNSEAGPSTTGEKPAPDPLALIAGINWAQVFQFTTNANAGV